MVETSAKPQDSEEIVLNQSTVGEDEKWSQVFQRGVKNDKQSTLSIGVVGRSGVGKTSLIQKFIDPNQQIQFGKAISTIGLDQFNMYLQFMDHPLKVRIWDTAG